MSRPETEALFLEYLETQASLICLEVTSDLSIRKGNRAAKSLLSPHIEGMPLDQLFLNFSNTLDIRKLAQEPEESHLISVNVEESLPQSYLFHFYPLEDGFLILGEMDYEEAEKMRRNLFELTNEMGNLTRELHKKNAELERVNDLKNEFVGMAAHDLRTPIGAIKGYSDLLINKVNNILPAQHLTFLKTIQSLSEFMLVMLNDLLDITAIESGKVKLNKSTIPFVSFMEQQVSMHQMLADKRDIFLMFYPPEKELMVHVDPFKVRQVVDNLISNALKYSESGSTVVTQIKEEEGQAVFYVKDRGPGIPREDLGKLFKPFSKTAVRVQKGEKSTGLGLAIAKKIVEAHDGKIWAESVEGEGSCFYVSLPLYIQETAKEKV